jgi:hypothetical protein
MDLPTGSAKFHRVSRTEVEPAFVQLSAGSEAKPAAMLEHLKLRPQVALRSSGFGGNLAYQVGVHGCQDTDNQQDPPGPRVEQSGSGGVNQHWAFPH